MMKHINSPIFIFLQGAQVTVFVRDKKKAEALFCEAKGPGSITYAVGVLFQGDEFKNAIKGHTRLFLLTLQQPDEASLVRIAKDAGVKHVVKLSCLGASVGAEPGSIFYLHGKAEFDILNIDGIAKTFLRCVLTHLLSCGEHVNLLLSS